MQLILVPALPLLLLGVNGLGGAQFGTRIQILRIDRVRLVLLGTGGCGGEVLLLQAGRPLHYHPAELVRDGVLLGLLLGEVLRGEHLAFLLLFERPLQFRLLVQHAFAHFLVEHELPMQLLSVRRIEAGVGQLLRDDQPLRVGHDSLRGGMIDRGHHSRVRSVIAFRFLILVLVLSGTFDTAVRCVVVIRVSSSMMIAGAV